MDTTPKQEVTTLSLLVASEKWFPLVTDMIAKFEANMRSRRSVLHCFEDARNPLLASKAEVKKLSAGPRLGMTWRELPREEWFRWRYDGRIADAERMVGLMRVQGRHDDADIWRVEPERRRSLPRRFVDLKLIACLAIDDLT